jgi:uncharacterized membrane-anchored protein
MFNDVNPLGGAAAIGTRPPRAGASKVPAVTALFWILKIAATTLGETGGDAVTMSLGLGYLVGSLIFTALFATMVIAQISARSFRPWLYWATIVATTTLGTTVADFTDRSLGIGYAGGVTLLSTLLLCSLLLWFRVAGTVSAGSVTTPKAESFYWITIMFSQTLGTALGDWTADSAGLGFAGSSMVFGGLLLLIVGAYYLTRLSRTALFWVAFILTRPLGAVLGDLLDKPVHSGGMAFSRYTASLILLVFMVACLVIFRQQPNSTGEAA